MSEPLRLVVSELSCACLAPLIFCDINNVAVEVCASLFLSRIPLSRCACSCLRCVQVVRQEAMRSLSQGDNTLPALMGPDGFCLRGW